MFWLRDAKGIVPESLGLGELAFSTSEPVAWHRITPSDTVWPFVSRVYALVRWQEFGMLG